MIDKLGLKLFDFIDKKYHQAKLLKSLKKLNIKYKNFIDIGGHLGSYTYFINNNFNLKKIYIFEPQKEIFFKLKKNLKKNKNIKFFNSAISDFNGEKNLNINKHDLSSTFHNLNKKNLFLHFKAFIFRTNFKNMLNKKEKVKTITLHKFLKKEKIKEISLIKIDTEGHELKVLKSLKKRIADTRVIIIEFHKNNVFSGYDSNNLKKFFKKHNFKLFAVHKFPFLGFEDRIYINKLY